MAHPSYYDPLIVNEEAEIDPFDRFSNKSIDMYIFTLAAQRENKNITIYSSIVSIPKNLGRTFPIIYSEGFDQYLRSPSYWILVQSTGIKFLTCHEQTYIGFGFCQEIIRIKSFTWEKKL